MRIHARTSNRVLTQRDPYVNLLRNTVAVFAAGVGGADAITSVPFDAMIGLPDDFSRRVARNTVLVLQEEAHLHRVIDPAGGSWFLDQLTEELAGKAWADLSGDRTPAAACCRHSRAGWIAEQIDAAYAPRAKDIARRKEGITGVSEFPDVTRSESIHVSARSGSPARGGRNTDRECSQDRWRRSATLTSAADPIAGRGRSRSRRCDDRPDRQRSWFPTADRPNRLTATRTSQLRRTVRAAARCQRRLAGNSRPATASLPGESSAPSPITPHARRGRRISSKPAVSR